MVEHQPSKLNVDGSSPFARCEGNLLAEHGESENRNKELKTELLFSFGFQDAVPYSHRL